jgi:spore maturation protein CgeB
MLETEDIEDIASHLKPKVIILYKSSKPLILLVEYFSTTSSKSSLFIHSQLSLTKILSIHPFSISIVILELQASILFSINSFITETGLSTTSQAAI